MWNAQGIKSLVWVAQDDHIFTNANWLWMWLSYYLPPEIHSMQIHTLVFLCVCVNQSAPQMKITPVVEMALSQTMASNAVQSKIPSSLCILLTMWKNLFVAGKQLPPWTTSIGHLKLWHRFHRFSWKIELQSMCKLFQACFQTKIVLKKQHQQQSKTNRNLQWPTSEILLVWVFGSKMQPCGKWQSRHGNLQISQQECQNCLKVCPLQISPMQGASVLCVFGFCIKPFSVAWFGSNWFLTCVIFWVHLLTNWFFQFNLDLWSFGHPSDLHQLLHLPEWTFCSPVCQPPHSACFSDNHGCKLYLWNCAHESCSTKCVGWMATGVPPRTRFVRWHKVFSHTHIIISIFLDVIWYVNASTPTLRWRSMGYRVRIGSKGRRNTLHIK